MNMIARSIFDSHEKVKILFINTVCVEGFYQKVNPFTQAKGKKIDFELQFEIGEEKVMALFEFNEQNQMLYCFVPNDYPEQTGHDCPFFYVGIKQEDILVYGV